MEKVLRATVGGLLHDIGKIWAQGSRGEPHRSHWNCTERGRCSCRERYGHAHAAMGGHLVADIFGQDSPYAELVALHHSKEGDDLPLERFVKQGDQLSAGERDEVWDADDGERDVRPLLINPLSARGVKEQRLDVRSLEDGWPPVYSVGQLDEVELRQRYDALAKKFIDGGQYLRNLDGDALVDGVIGLLENVGSMVPSAFWKTTPDISLAMHLQVAGAFAGALAAVDDADADPCATLIAGDLSGIQAFLHQAATAKAARQLRARSFYLSLLALVVARTIARELRVTPASVVLASGGNFLLIAPPGVEEKVSELAECVTKTLIEFHGPVLDVVVATGELRRADTKMFADAVARVRQRLQVEKLRKKVFWDEVFWDEDVGKLRDACQSCGGDLAQPRNEEERFCDFCWDLVELGRELPDVNFLTISEVIRSEDGSVITGWRKAFAKLGWDVQLHRSPPETRTGQRRSLFVLDGERVKERPYARLLLAGRYAPRREEVDAGALAEFDELARRGPGRHLLAAAKLDVDDLGQFFGKLGQGNSVASPSRYASASRFLTLFFEGHVDVRAGKRERQDIYLVYSGGDDAALVGHWWSVLEFVAELRDDFDSWTGGNPALHFSAGVAFGAGEQPLLLALSEAEEALHRAKDCEGKDRCTVFGYPFTWSDLKVVTEWARRLQSLVEEEQWSVAQTGRLSRNVLQVLQAAEEAVNAVDPLGKPLYGPVMWRIPHRVRRAFTGPEVAGNQLVADVERELTADGGAARLASAARLAEWLTRKEGTVRTLASSVKRSQI